MDNADVIDPDLIDLVVRLSTRIGMIMEDVNPVAINASPVDLPARVAEVARAIRTAAKLANALEVLLEG